MHSFFLAILESETGTGGATKTGDAAAGGAATGGDSSMMMIVIVMIGFFVLMTIFNGRGRKKQQAKFTDMYEGLKRDDRIMLQNGKFVVVDSVDKDRITVFADVAKHVREVYHKNAVASLESEVFPDAETKKMDDQG